MWQLSHEGVKVWQQRENLRKMGAAAGAGEMLEEAAAKLRARLVSDLSGSVA